MAKGGINIWLQNLKSTNPQAYQELILRRNRKAAATRHAKSEAKKIEQQARKNPNRVAGGKKAWATRQERAWAADMAAQVARDRERNAEIEYEQYMRQHARQRYEQRLDKILSIEPTDIPKLTNDELKSLIDEARSAIEYREWEFMQHYTELTGKDEFDFKREKFEYTDEDSTGKLRHILRMEQRYLERKNTWEDYSAQIDKFMDRVSSKGIGREMSFEEKLKYRKRFFELYDKAKELYNSGSDESKGSPLYAEVAEIMENNPDISMSDFIDKMEQNYVERQEEAERKLRDEGGLTTADFFGLSDDDLI